MNLPQLETRLALSSLSAQLFNRFLEQIDAVLLREGFTDEDRENGISIDTSPDESIAEALLSMALAFRRSGSLSDQGLLLVRDALIECADDAERVRSVEAELAVAAATGPISDCLDPQLVARLQGKIGSAPKGERDPNGIGAHSPGAKLDAGKNRCALVINGFSRALWQVCLVGTFGAAKYTPNGWKEVENGIERYSDAMDRHLLMEASGEECDPDSGLLHAAHAAWNALARLDLMLKERPHD